jgi:uncharacterized membrane protein YkvI
MASQFTGSLIMAGIVIIVVLVMIFLPLLREEGIQGILTPLLLMFLLTVVNVLTISLT